MTQKQEKDLLLQINLLRLQNPDKEIVLMGSSKSLLELGLDKAKQWNGCKIKEVHYSYLPESNNLYIMALPTEHLPIKIIHEGVGEELKNLLYPIDK
jgi:hypothetical protein